MSFFIKIGPLSLIHEKSVGIDQINAKSLHFSKAFLKLIGSAIIITFSNLDSFSANITISNSSEENVLSCDKILVAIGASANIESLGLENIDIQTTNGFIEIDDYMSTNVKGIYAIGDVTGKLLLAKVVRQVFLVLL